MLRFEDIWGGGDNDFNDTVFALKGLTHTPPRPPSSSVPTPEPGTLLGTLFAFGVMGLTSVQKRQAKKS